MALIAAENLDVRFGRTQALFGVSLKIEKGEIVTIAPDYEGHQITKHPRRHGCRRASTGTHLFHSYH